jgi:superfamily II DNA helicase RecQ
MNRIDAEKELFRLFGFKQFYDLQWEVIDHLFAGRRVLLIAPLVIAKTVGGDLGE